MLRGVKLPQVAALTAAALVASALDATTVLPPTFDQLVASAESVVRGTVLDVRCEWRGSEDERRIVTIVTVDVLETVVGQKSPQLELQFLGGEINGERLVVEGQPAFALGDEDFLFVAGNGQRICPLVGMMYGRYLVASDASGKELIARNNGVPLASVQEVVEPMGESSSRIMLHRPDSESALTPAAFADAVRESARRQGRSDIVQP